MLQHTANMSRQARPILQTEQLRRGVTYDRCHAAAWSLYSEVVIETSLAAIKHARMWVVFHSVIKAITGDAGHAVSM